MTDKPIQVDGECAKTHEIWNDLPQMPVSSTVHNFHKCLQRLHGVRGGQDTVNTSCDSIPLSDRNLASKQLFNC